MKPTKSILFHLRPIILIAAVSMVLSALLLWNSSALKRELAHSTEEYVMDVSAQLAGDISSRLDSFQQALESVACTLSPLPDQDALQASLNRQAQILGFDALAVIAPGGAAVPQGFPKEYLQDRQNELFSGPAVTYLGGQDLLFSVPLEAGGPAGHILAGVRSKENIQALIEPKSYNGRGLTCIVNSSGAVVISPTDLKPFLQLGDIFSSGADAKAQQAISHMITGMAAQRSGVFQFTAVDGSNLVLSYHPLNANGWILLTLVPADLISGNAGAYIFRSFLLIAGGLLVLGLLFLALVQTYRANRRQLESVAYTDPLTGGLNRAAFQRAYQKLASGMPPSSCTLVFLDVKGFKLINESLGVRAGNKILQYICQTLQQHLQPGEIAARVNADQFVLCLQESAPGQVQARLDKMVGAINSAGRPAELQYALTIPQGACLIDDPATDLMLIEERARTACKLQSERSVCSFYNSDLIEKIKREQELNAQLPLSLAHGDFYVYLQPKVRLRDGALGGAEALVRWRHPQYGMIPPGEFIPLFERNGSVCTLDLYLFEQICALLRRWMDQGRAPLPISFNLSRVHFKNPNYLEPFLRLKEQYRIPNGILEMELTESTFFDEQQRQLVQSSIVEMHRHGFLCSLDDFGVGFSALALLKDFDVDAIKLDRQFFSEIASSKSRAVISGFIALAQTLGIHTVAEGIETREQADFLRQAGCDMIQGFYFSKPLPIPEFETWAPSRPPEPN
ncbi:EAL domain-containing protein [Allofournierella sp.]|uniref:bifunctional diguanylate cyclase/phosphodiesterase n=1 Tax=Allofournierella sp. TaxID=1940256 RepID=UPI003AF1129F